MKKLLSLVAMLALASVVHADTLTANPKAGEGKVVMCIGCHGIPGYKTAFPDVYQVPMLANQSAKFLENALKAYKAGQRKHPTMRSVAASLSEQDILDIAAYYSAAQQK